MFDVVISRHRKETISPETAKNGDLKMKATMKISIRLALTAALLSTSAIAEPRVWTDAKGKTIKAELVRVLNSQAELRLASGREISVSLNTLSEDDRRFAMLSQMPTLELNVAAKTDRTSASLFQIGRASPAQIKKESTVVTVDVLKLSFAAYEEPLKAVLYVMGADDDENVVVLDKATKTFTYLGQNKEFEFVSAAYETETRGDVINGEAYEGWLVAVFDSRGTVVAMKSSAPEFERNADALLAVETAASRSVAANPALARIAD
jgi:hypothetical protein